MGYGVFTGRARRCTRQTLICLERELNTAQPTIHYGIC